MTVSALFSFLFLYSIRLKTIFAALRLPFRLLKAFFAYYVTGTKYNQNKEISKSLLHTLVVTAVANFGECMTRDAALISNEPLQDIIERFKKNPMVAESQLKNYGKQYTQHSYWLSHDQSDSADKENVLVYLHGGGYMLKLMDLQFAGILALYHGITARKQKDLSVLVVDYSVSADGYQFPTQLHETLQAYKKLADDGYKKIHLIGDSAGGNLALAISRFTAYPGEAESHFDLYSARGFDFNFGHLPQPFSLTLISPWTRPSIHSPRGKHKNDDKGDIIGIGAEFSKELFETKEDMGNWADFVHKSHDENWSNVSALNGQGESLVIWGGKEYIREQIEDWIDTVKQGPNKLICHVETHGIHDSLFYVESIDYVLSSNARKALKGDLGDKFGLNLARDFIARQI